ncbi:MAG: GTPase Era [FCB group bacterium]|jgi:GTP-binding protein Era
MPTKAGTVVIVGMPNVGKSTLLNAALGTKLSIVTPKPQTTRKRVLGILTNDDNQIIFIDTPGHIKPKYELHRTMIGYISDSIAYSEIVLVLIDINSFNNGETLFSDEFIFLLKNCGKPIILCINKIDLLKNIKEVLPFIAESAKLKLFNEIVPVSALKNIGIDELIKVLKNYLPESPFLYDAELISTQNERFFVAEIIRENIFNSYGDEIPFSTEVEISEFKERENGKWYISADIIIERDSQKKIIIGEKGSKIKSVGERARADIEKHLEMPVYLELFVKVRQKWRNDKNLLKSYGY